MTVKFENKHSGEIVALNDVSLLSGETKCFSTIGYGIDFADGTFCVMDRSTFRLITVKA
jgi:hypothetical protein